MKKKKRGRDSRSSHSLSHHPEIHKGTSHHSTEFRWFPQLSYRHISINSLSLALSSLSAKFQFDMTSATRHLLCDYDGASINNVTPTTQVRVNRTLPNDKTYKQSISKRSVWREGGRGRQVTLVWYTVPWQWPLCDSVQTWTSYTYFLPLMFSKNTIVAGFSSFHIQIGFRVNIETKYNNNSGS